MPKWERREVVSLVREAPRFDEPMKEHTTIKVGGCADVFLTVQDLPELKRVVEYAREKGVPLLFLGGGSNLIVRDGGIRGIVVRLGKGFRYLNFNSTNVTAGASYFLPRLIEEAAERGLGGLEAGVGVPGSVGGSIVSNAGTASRAIGERVLEVKVLTQDGDVKSFDRCALEFSYRTSNVERLGLCVIEATFGLEPDDPCQIKQRIHNLTARRNKTQPVKLPNAGCIFRNPPALHAGKLLDEAGAKGMTCGKAQVSTLHANFIVNLGGAKAQDVLTLVEKMQELVYQKFGILLEREVRVVGE